MLRRLFKNNKFYRSYYRNALFFATFKNLVRNMQFQIETKDSFKPKSRLLRGILCVGCYFSIFKFEYSYTVLLLSRLLGSG